MGVPLEEMMARLPEERRRRVVARAAELIAEEMSLRALRKAMGKTQAAMARRLGVKQENVSRMEQRADMLLSTLGGFVRAAGGSLHLVVEFEDRPPVRLADLASIGPGDETPRARRDAHRSAAPKQRLGARFAAAKKPAGAYAGGRLVAAAKKSAAAGAKASGKRPAAARTASARGRAPAKADRQKAS